MPETTLEPRGGEGREGFTTRNKLAAGDAETNDLVRDIRTCIAKGFSDQRIQKELSLKDVTLVTYFRNKTGELDEILGLPE